MRDHWQANRARAVDLTASGSSAFVKEPGIAQSVHWARTSESGLNLEAMASLLDSDLQIEDGLIDGLYTNFGTLADSLNSDDDIVAWGHATHVGCGWIQFPANVTGEDGPAFENFMVCNYAIGDPGKDSCDLEASVIRFSEVC